MNTKKMYCSLITPSRKYYNYYGLQIVLQLLEEGGVICTKSTQEYPNNCTNQ